MRLCISQDIDGFMLQMGAPSSGKFGQFLESMARRRTNPNRRLGASTFPRRSAQGLSKLGFLGDRDIRLNGGGAPFTAPLARCIRRHVRMERFSISPDRAQVEFIPSKSLKGGGACVFCMQKLKPENVMSRNPGCSILLVPLNLQGFPRQA